jgi:putative tricarboxylic transport membrane protein
MRVNDALAGVAVAALGLFVVLYAQTLPARPGIQFGPAFFPRLLGIGLALGGLWLIATGWPELRRGRLVHLPDWSGSLYHVLGIPLVLGLLVFYILAADRLGFLLTAFLILSVFQLWLRVRVPVALAVAVVASLGLQQAFARLLRVPVPRGPVEALLFG